MWVEHASNTRALVRMRKRRQLQSLAAAPSNSMETFETWTAEEVSEWLVENGLSEDVARTFEGTVFHPFHFVPICGL